MTRRRWYGIELIGDGLRQFDLWIRANRGGGHSGSPKMMARITIAAGTPRSKEGICHDQMLIKWPVPDVVHAQMIEPTYQ